MSPDALTVITLSLVVSFLLSQLLFRFKHPRVIGQILAGIVLGMPFLRGVFNAEVLTDIGFLSDIGIVFLLLLIGLQLNLEKFRRAGKDASIVALLCVLFPFLLGFGLVKVAGYSTTVALIVASCFSLTAEGTKLKVLLDMRALNTRLGMVMLAAGIIDDLFEILFLTAVLMLAHGTLAALVWLPVKFIIFIGAVMLTYKVFPALLGVVRKEHSRVSMFSFILVFSLIIAVVSKQLEFGPIIGAFVAGLIIRVTEHKKEEYKDLVKELEGMTFAFIIPFFFINIGLHFDWTSLTQNFWLTIMVLFLGTLGKILGGLASKLFTTLSVKQAYLVGWGMNSRGAVELIIAEMARANNLIPIELYSAVVFMAVVTTLTFPLMMKVIVSRDRSVLQ